MRRRIIAVLVVIILIILGVLAFLKFYHRTYVNSSDVSGNIAGNIYNEGLFCERDGVLYFANPDDGFKLYSMPVLGGEAKKLSDDSVRYINVDDHYIYYTKGNTSIKEETSDEPFGFLHINEYSLVRVDLDGSHKKYLDEDPCLYLILCGNDLYYMHYDNDDASTLYHVDTDGGNREQVKEEALITGSASNGYVYYNGVDQDHFLYSLEGESGSAKEILSGNNWMPIATDDYIYYLDLSQNYALCRIPKGSVEPETLVEESIENYNIYGDTLYYQTFGDDAGLYSYNMVNDESTLIAEGNYYNINVTSTYVYFRAFETDTVYCCPVNSQVSVSEFHPGSQD